MRGRCWTSRPVSSTRAGPATPWNRWSRYCELPRLPKHGVGADAHETYEFLRAPPRAQLNAKTLGVSSYGGSMQTTKGEECMQHAVEHLVTLFENGTLNRQ